MFNAIIGLLLLLLYNISSSIDSSSESEFNVDSFLNLSAFSDTESRFDLPRNSQQSSHQLEIHSQIIDKQNIPNAVIRRKGGRRSKKREKDGLSRWQRYRLKRKSRVSFFLMILQQFLHMLKYTSLFQTPEENEKIRMKENERKRKYKEKKMKDPISALEFKRSRSKYDRALYEQIKSNPQRYAERLEKARVSSKRIRIKNKEQKKLQKASNIKQKDECNIGLFHSKPMMSKRGLMFIHNYPQIFLLVSFAYNFFYFYTIIKISFQNIFYFI